MSSRLPMGVATKYTTPGSAPCRPPLRPKPAPSSSSPASPSAASELAGGARDLRPCLSPLVKAALHATVVLIVLKPPSPGCRVDQRDAGFARSPRVADLASEQRAKPAVSRLLRPLPCCAPRLDSSGRQRRWRKPPLLGGSGKVLLLCLSVLDGPREDGLPVVRDAKRIPTVEERQLAVLTTIPADAIATMVVAQLQRLSRRIPPVSNEEGGIHDAKK